VNRTLEKFARDYLKENIAKLPAEKNQSFFKKMYAAGKLGPSPRLDMPIEDIIDAMPVLSLDWAIVQVQNTLFKYSVFFNLKHKNSIIWKWLDENISNGWAMGDGKIKFQVEKDAALFKLFFS
jgi:hypothetical protein